MYQSAFQLCPLLFVNFLCYDSFLQQYFSMTCTYFINSLSAFMITIFIEYLQQLFLLVKQCFVTFR